MRVVVPYSPGQLHPRVVPSIVAQGYEAETYECVNIVGDPMSYPALLHQWLTSGEDVCIVEHDNESRPGFLADLDACPEPWCFYAYDLSIPWEDAILDPGPNSAPLGELFAPLGHTRFRAGVGDLILPTLTAGWFRESWVARDTWVSGALNAVGLIPHRHPGKALHHHQY